MEAVMEKEVDKELDIIDVQVTAIETKAETNKINNQDDYALVGAFFKAIKSEWKRVEAKRKEEVQPLKDIANAKHDKYKLRLNRLVIAEGKTESLLLDYERKKEIEEKKEQDRIDAIADKKRIAAEEQTQKWIAKNKPEKAAEIIQKKVLDVPVITVQPKIQKVQGVSKRDNWEFKVIDENLIPNDYKMIDMQKIGKVVRATKGTLQIPGIKTQNIPIIVNR